MFISHLGWGWWSFDSLHADADDEIENRCDFVKLTCHGLSLNIYIDGNLQFSKSFPSVISFDIGAWRSPKIRKTSLVRFEMFHNSFLVFDQTLTIEQLIERPRLRISEKHNEIKLENPAWMDDFNYL